MSGAEGTLGGTKPPGSGPAPVQKLATSVCALCRLRAPAPIVVDGLCANEGACRKRVTRNAADTLAEQARR